MVAEDKKGSSKTEKLDSKNRKGSDSSDLEKLNSAEGLTADAKVTNDKGGDAKDKKMETENKMEEKKEDVKTEKKSKAKEIVKKDVAIANGFSLRISPKQSKYVMRIIRGKTPDAAVVRLQAVIDEKRPVPMAGLEVGHKKGKGLAGGRFPKNACIAIMEIVKQVKANAVVAEIEDPVISIAKADRASAPYRKAGRKAKRCHVHIEVIEKVKLLEKRKK